MNTSSVLYIYLYVLLYLLTTFDIYLFFIVLEMAEEQEMSPLEKKVAEQIEVRRSLTGDAELKAK